MPIIEGFARSMQSLLTDWAQAADQAVSLIVRQRKFSASALAQTIALTPLEKPTAVWTDFAHTAGLLNVRVTPHAIKERFTPRLVEFSQALLPRAIAGMVAAKPLPIPLPQRFQGVYVGDGTIVTLPAELAEQYPGCGGGGGQAAMKAQARMNLSTGQIDYFSLEAGRDCDVESPLQTAATPAGSLVILDLGYFDVAQLAERDRQGVYFLSRIQCGTSVWTGPQHDVTLVECLRAHTGRDPVDREVIVGASQKLKCRLLAPRCPPEVIAQRRRQLRRGRAPSASRLAWCDWQVFITNLPAHLADWQDIVVLYRSRWQIELLFKQWKSQGHIDRLQAGGQRASPHQILGFVPARLIAVLLQHGLILASRGQNIAVSLLKAGRVVRSWTKPLAVSFQDLAQLGELLTRLSPALEQTAVDRRRQHPSWFQLLLDPGLVSHWQVNMPS